MPALEGSLGPLIERWKDDPGGTTITAVADLTTFDEALLIMATLPFALVDGIWLLFLLSYKLSVAGPDRRVG